MMRSPEEAHAIDDQMAAALERRQRRPQKRRRQQRREDRRPVCPFCFQPGVHASAAQCLRALERA